MNGIMNNVEVADLKRRGSVDFSGIRATVSPYAIREGERVEIMRPDRRRGYIDSLNITERERLVLGCVNYLMFATSMQIHWMLSGHAITQDEIHKILTKMFNAGYLHKLHFVTDNGMSNFKVYALTGERGYTLYKSIFGGRANSKRDFFERDDLVVRAKQILSTNQLMAQLSSVKKTAIPSHCQVFSVQRFLQKPMLLRTAGFVATEENAYWVESVRRNIDHIENFENRLERFKYFRKNHKKIGEVCGESLGAVPRMLVITEDEEHMREIAAVIAAHDLQSVLITSDMTLIGEWDKAFFEVV